MATFAIDICKGKDRDQLCADYRRMSRLAHRRERIIMSLVNAAPEAVAKLPPEYRQEIEKLIEACKD